MNFSRFEEDSRYGLREFLYDLTHEYWFAGLLILLMIAAALSLPAMALVSAL